MLSLLLIFIATFINASDGTLTLEQRALVKKTPEYWQQTYERRSDELIWQDLQAQPHFLAALAGDEKKFNEIVSAKKINIKTARFADNSNLLHFAAVGGSEAIIKKAIYSYINPDGENIKGFVPLFFACMYKQLRAAELLHVCSIDRYRPMWLYALEPKKNKRKLDEDLLEWNSFEDLLDENIRTLVKDVPLVQGTNILFWAACFGCDSLWLSLGLNPDYDYNVSILKANDAKLMYPYAQHVSQNIAIEADRYNNEILFIRPKGINSFCKTSQRCDTTCVKPFFLYGYKIKNFDITQYAISDKPVNAIDEIGITPIMYAGGQALLKEVSQLYKGGANLFHRDNYEQSLLDVIKNIQANKRHFFSYEQERKYQELLHFLQAHEKCKEAALQQIGSAWINGKDQRIAPIPADIIKQIRTYVEH